MIICCGESLIDMVPEAIDDKKLAFVPYAGGAVFNTAIALGRLKSKVGFISGISRDQFGEILLQQLHDSEVNTDLVLHNDKLTCLACIKLKNGQASYTFYDENSATRSITPQEVPESLPDYVNALFFGGISLAVSPCADFYTAMAERFSHQCLIAIDPNIRPSFIQNEKDYRARIKKLIGIADIIKLSDEDFLWLIQRDEITQSDIDKILDKNPSKILIITKGKKGASAYRYRRKNITSKAVNTDVVDTIGAGDTFDAAFLHFLNEIKPLQRANIDSYSDEEIKRAMDFANRAAAVTVSRTGANPPWAHELN